MHEQTILDSTTWVEKLREMEDSDSLDFDAIDIFSTHPNIKGFLIDSSVPYKDTTLNVKYKSFDTLEDFDYYIKTTPNSIFLHSIYDMYYTPKPLRKKKRMRPLYYIFKFAELTL